MFRVRAGLKEKSQRQRDSRRQPRSRGRLHGVGDPLDWALWALGLCQLGKCTDTFTAEGAATAPTGMMAEGDPGWRKGVKD